MPWPKLKWRFGVRPMSNACGRSKTNGSLFAAPTMANIRSPCLRFLPPQDRFSVTTLAMLLDGPSNRKNSSTADLMSSGSSRRRCNSLGLASKAATELPSRLVVVSWPPNKISRHMATNSSSPNLPSASSAAIIMLITSSVGSKRRCSMCPRK